MFIFKVRGSNMFRLTMHYFRPAASWTGLKGSNSVCVCICVVAEAFVMTTGTNNQGNAVFFPIKAVLINIFG